MYDVQRTEINAAVTNSPFPGRHVGEEEVIREEEPCPRVNHMTADEAPKVFPHCHNGCMEVMTDYLGLEKSIFHLYGGMKTLRNDVNWYRELRPTKKDNETAKSYVRRLCLAGERLESLIDDDMEVHHSSFVNSLHRVCKLVDQAASNGSKNNRYVSLSRIIDASGRIGKT